MEEGAILQSQPVRSSSTDAWPKCLGAHEERNNWYTCRQESWRALVHLKAQGVVRSIGVSNFLTRHLEEFLTPQSVWPELLQTELHPWYYDRQLIGKCRWAKIAVQAYASLGGMLGMQQ